MAETSIFLAGNLTSDPELRYTARATFRGPVSARVRDGEQSREGKPAFYSSKASLQGSPSHSAGLLLPATSPSGCHPALPHCPVHGEFG